MPYDISQDLYEAVRLNIPIEKDELSLSLSLCHFNTTLRHYFLTQDLYGCEECV